MPAYFVLASSFVLTLSSSACQLIWRAQVLHAGARYLAILDLGCNIIRDEGCIAVANAIKGNHASSLRWLSMQRNGITAEGVQVSEA